MKTDATHARAERPSDRLRANIRLALRLAEEHTPDIETMDSICCALALAHLELDDLEVLFGIRSPAEADRAVIDKGIKVYRGWRVYERGQLRHAVAVNGRLLDPRPSRRLIDYAERFAWGDTEPAGAAQLALAILLDYFAGCARRAVEMHQEFLAAVITRLPRQGEWAFSNQHIESALIKDLRDRVGDAQ